MVPWETSRCKIRTRCGSSTHVGASVKTFSHAGAESLRMSYFVDSTASGPAPYSAVRPAVAVSGPLPALPLPTCLSCLPLPSCILTPPGQRNRGPTPKVGISLESFGGAKV